MPDPIFREVSADRGSLPDQLDQLLQITRPRGWVALAAISALLVAGLVWGIFGRIDDHVQAQGILLRSGGVLEIVAPAAGRVMGVDVQVGDSVRQGQLVASLAQPELRDDILRARDFLATAQQAYTRERASSANDAALLQRSLTQQRSNLQFSIRATAGVAASLSERLQGEQQLLARGLIAKPTLIATRQQYEEAQERVRSYSDELQKLDIAWGEAASHRASSLDDAEFKQRNAEHELARLDAQMTSNTRVVSDIRGRVLEIMTEPGRIAARGEPLLTLDRAGGVGQDLVAVFYIPALIGKRVKPGMTIQIVPTTVRQEEYGMLLGTVTFVSTFPATNKGMQRVLKNDQLIEQLSGGGAPYEVHARLLPDAANVSRYRWTSAKGPPSPVESGTLAAATIIVGHQMPISMVLPILQRARGS